MADSIKLKARVVQKHATESEWNSSELIPFQGEIVVYDVDENYRYERMKIGDGVTLVKDLPFSSGSSQSVQPDWNQTDETAADFIKNRPFYETKERITLLPETEATPLSIWEAPLSVLSDGKTLTTVSAGETYVVTFDGVEYECVAQKDSEMGYTFMGNGDLVGFAQGNEEPFVLIGGSLVVADSGEHFIKVEQNGKVVLFEQTVSVSDIPVKCLDLSPLVSGETYNIVLNNVEYECVANVSTSSPGIVLSNDSSEETEGGLFHFDLGQGLLRTNEGPECSIQIRLGEEEIFSFNSTLSLYDFMPAEGSFPPLLWPEETYTVIFDGIEYSCVSWLEDEVRVILGKTDSEPFGFAHNIDSPSWGYSIQTEIPGEHTIEVYFDGQYILPQYNFTTTEEEPFVWVSLWEEGQTYIVTLNGTEYECVSWGEGQAIYLGSEPDHWLESEVPFLWGVYADDNTWMLAANTECVFKIDWVTNGGVVKIDPKFLPKTLEQVQSDWNQTDETAVDFIKNKPELSHALTMIDVKTGYEYIAQIYDGNLVTYRKFEKVEITRYPEKCNYVVGDTFDPTGLIITGTYSDGTSVSINEYFYPDVITEDNLEVFPIYCVNGGVTVEISFLQALCQDFEYRINEDETITLTDWKQTYNGVASGELIIPEDERIIL